MHYVCKYAIRSSSVTECPHLHFKPFVSQASLQVGDPRMTGGTRRQSAIAARPSSSHKGYVLGGILWFCIPFTLATCLGLASRALDLPLTADEAGEGLVPPAAATYLLGKGGSVLIVLMLFMAVTSSGAPPLPPPCLPARQQQARPPASTAVLPCSVRPPRHGRREE